MNKLGPYPMNSIVTGDARELAKAIPSGSVDLILTDPEYDHLDDYYWLYTECKRILKPEGNTLAFVNAKWYAVVSRVVMSDFPPLACVQTSGPSPMNGRIIAKTYYLLWFGSGKLKGYMPDGYIGTSWSKPHSHNHKWTKNPKYIKPMVLTESGQSSHSVKLFHTSIGFEKPLHVKRHKLNRLRVKRYIQAVCLLMVAR